MSNGLVFAEGFWGFDGSAATKPPHVVQTTGEVTGAPANITATRSDKGPDGAPSLHMTIPSGNAAQLHLRNAVIFEFPATGKVMASFSLRPVGTNIGSASSTGYGRFCGFIHPGRIGVAGGTVAVSSPLALQGFSGPRIQVAYLPGTGANHAALSRTALSDITDITTAADSHFEMYLDVTNPAVAEYAVWLDGVQIASGIHNMSASAPAGVDYSKISHMSWHPQLVGGYDLINLCIFDMEHPDAPALPFGIVDTEMIHPLEGGNFPISPGSAEMTFPQTSGAMSAYFSAGIDIQDFIEPQTLRLENLTSSAVRTQTLSPGGATSVFFDFPPDFLESPDPSMRISL